MEDDRREFFKSSNGDRWLLVKVAGGGLLVRHEPVPASGGKTSEIGIDVFAGRNPDAPERRALVDLLRQFRKEQASQKRTNGPGAANGDDPTNTPTAK
jgi:hypothetical protein